MASPTRMLENALAGDVNVGRSERLLSTAVGAMLAVGGLRRGGVRGILSTGLGAALLHRGITGHCMVYDALGIDSTRGTGGDRDLLPAHGDRMETAGEGRPRTEAAPAPS